MKGYIMSFVTSVITAIQSLIDDTSGGWGTDPEVDFDSMSATDDLIVADHAFYMKTGKMISVDRIRRPPKVVIFLDINTNMCLKMRDVTSWLKDALRQIIYYLEWESIVEVRDGQWAIITDHREECVERYHYREYESHIDTILESAKQEHIVCIVSDFLACDTMSNIESVVTNGVVLQLELPIRSAQYHSYYLKSLPKISPSTHRFKV